MINLWIDIVLAFNKQAVRHYRCIYEFECVIAWFHARWYHRDCVLACYSNTLQWRWHMTLRWCWIWYRVGFEWTARMLVSVHVWICVHHYLVSCTMTPSRLHTHLVFKYNGNYIRLCTNIDSDTIWHHRDCVLACYANTLQWRWHIWHCTDVGWIYETVLCWLGLNRQYVVIGACVNLNVPLLDIRYTMRHESIIIALAPAIQTHYNGNAHGSALMLIEHTERYRVGFGWTESTLVLWCMLGFKCVIAIRRTTTPSQLRTRLLLKYTIMTIITYGVALMLIEYMARCYVGLGRTERTLVIVYVWIWMCHYLLGFLYGTRCKMTASKLHARLLDIQLLLQSRMPWTNRKYVGIGACTFIITWCTTFHEWYDRNLLRTRTLFNDNGDDIHTALHWGWFWLNTWNGIALALNEQTVSCNLLAHVWIWMLVCHATWHHHNCTHACYSNTLQWQWLMARRWCWLNVWNAIVPALAEQAVRCYCGACLNLNVPLHGVRCTMAPSRLHTHLLFKYTTMAMVYASALILIECMKWYRAGFGRTVCTLLLVHLWIWMCHCLVYDALWYDRNCTLAGYSNTMTMAYVVALMLIAIAYVERSRVGF